jgi:benzoyl-CoA reductase/2-hydroxyglutaryl-CoA dehydratase subunit BcrC/BadD/HgdB
LVQSEFARILADPLELSRQWSREGRKVIGCLDSYIPEEFIHAAGMIPLRILGSTGNVTLADSYLPVFAGKLARSILEQGLRGDLVHLAGVAVSNSSDAVRMLYDLWDRHIPQQRAFLIDVPAILEGETNHRVFRQAMLDFKNELEKFAGKPLEPAILRRSIAVFNENRKLLKEMASSERVAAATQRRDLRRHSQRVRATKENSDRSAATPRIVQPQYFREHRKARSAPRFGSHPGGSLLFALSAEMRRYPGL